MYLYESDWDPLKVWDLPPYTQLYYDGRAIERFMLSDTFYNGPANKVVCVIKLLLDDKTTFLWRSDKHSPPTTVVPRKYCNHINLKLLEDIDHGS